MPWMCEKAKIVPALASEGSNGDFMSDELLKISNVVAANVASKEYCCVNAGKAEQILIKRRG